MESEAEIINAYDKLRGSMGFPIDAEVGSALAKRHSSKLKVIYEACKCYVVKLQAIGPTNTSFFNGFFYSESDVILTAGHILGFNGASKYTAVFNKGTSQEATYELEHVCVGSFKADAVTGTNIPYKVFAPDVAVFRCPYVPPHSPRPFAALVSPGDQVCVVGFNCMDEAQLSISDGIVSFGAMEALYITAHADDGYSGSPVLSTDGYMVGMVRELSNVSRRSTLI